MSELERARTEADATAADLRSFIGRVNPAEGGRDVTVPDTEEALTLVQAVRAGEAAGLPGDSFGSPGVREDLLPQIWELWEKAIAAAVRVWQLEEEGGK